MKYIAATALLLLALTIPGFNLYHHLVLPEFTSNKVDTSYSLDTTFPFIHTDYDITLPDVIKENSIAFYGVMKTLRVAKNGDVVRIHLAGYGGSAQVTALILDGMRTSRAKIITVIEAPVYSAHAYIALSGDEIVIKPFSYVMLHSSSALDIDCSGVNGLDRGQSKQDKCEQFKTNAMYQNVTMLLQLKYVTAAEKFQIISGYDVYIQADELQSRINSVRDN